MVITKYHGCKMGFVFEDMILTNTHLFSDESKVGNIYTARVDKKILNIDAAFLDIGESDPVYYQISEFKNRHIKLHGSKSDDLKTGGTILVMIDKDAAGTKKGVATADISLSGNDVIVNTSGSIGVSHKIKDPEIKDLLKKRLTEAVLSVPINNKDINYGVIARTSSGSKDVETVAEETIILLRKLDDIISRSKFCTPGQLMYKKEDSYVSFIKEVKRRYPDKSISVYTDDAFVYDILKDIYKTPDSDLYSFNTLDSINVSLFTDNLTNLINIYNIEKQMERALSRKVYISSGAELVIDRTEAATVIDVNSSKAIKGRDRDDFILSLNMKAATAIAKELVLRNISGIIIIDFVNMKKSDDYKKLINHLNNEISKDPIRCSYVDTTALGLVELTRKKTRKSLYEIMKNI